MMDSKRSDASTQGASSNEGRTSSKHESQRVDARSGAAEHVLEAECSIATEGVPGAKPSKGAKRAPAAEFSSMAERPRDAQASSVPDLSGASGVLEGSDAPNTSEVLFDCLGGDRLRAVLSDFYDRVYRDMMIGFMFRGVDKARLIDKEWEFVACLLGAKHVTYTGAPMRRVHARHRVMGGQFARRQHLLRETLRDHNVPEPVQHAWLEHNDSLRPMITQDSHGHCGV